MSRLLESMAADEGFQMDEDDSSFSEGDEDSNPSYPHNPRSPLGEEGTLSQFCNAILLGTK